MEMWEKRLDRKKKEKFRKKGKEEKKEIEENKRRKKEKYQKEIMRMIRVADVIANTIANDTSQINLKLKLY